MKESTRKRPAQEAALQQLQVIANIPPTFGQRRLVRVFVFALVAIFAVTWPFRALQLPELHAFIPAVAAALCVSDCVASALLFAQFAILRHWAILLIAGGYLFSALLVAAHGLAFPGAFTPKGFLVVGPGLQSAVWLYWLWHSALILGFIGYAMLKERQWANFAGSTSLAISLSIVAIFAGTVGIYWFVTQHEDVLPITYVDVRPISLFRHMVGGVSLVIVGVLALGLLWLRRRSLLDEWLIVALCAFLLEVLIVSAFANRYTLGWYAGRFYQLITATVVMVVLLAEMTRLYASLAHSNMLLQTERNNKLMTLEAMAASIAHEVRQPLATISTRGDTALRYLGREPIDTERVRSNVTAAISESRRASQIFDNIRALFGTAELKPEAMDVNEIALGVLHTLRPDLEDHGITTRTELTSKLPFIMGHSGQMHEVILNLVRNAIDAMDTVKDWRRILQVRTESRGPDAILIAVEDSGPGIDPEKFDRIFDPFVTTKSGGMGLGLAICRMIIERHGGQLYALQGTNRGALFQFVLPVKPT